MNRDLEIEKGHLPREKLLQFGVDSLTDAELLALFLRTGHRGMHVLVFAKTLLREFGSLHRLLSADYAHFKNVKGIGQAKYTQLNAIAELARRYYSSQGAKNSLCLRQRKCGSIFRFS